MVKPKSAKTDERNVAHDHGTERTRYSGGNSGMTRSDTLHPLLYIENKYQKANLPGETLFDLTIEKAEIEKKIPVLVMSKAGGRGRSRKRIVILRYKDYLDMMKPEVRFVAQDDEE